MRGPRCVAAKSQPCDLEWYGPTVQTGGRLVNETTLQWMSSPRSICADYHSTDSRVFFWTLREHFSAGGPVARADYRNPQSERKPLRGSGGRRLLAPYSTVTYSAPSPSGNPFPLVGSPFRACPRRPFRRVGHYGGDHEMGSLRERMSEDMVAGGPGASRTRLPFGRNRSAVVLASSVDSVPSGPRFTLPKKRAQPQIADLSGSAAVAVLDDRNQKFVFVNLVMDSATQEPNLATLTAQAVDRETERNAASQRHFRAPVAPSESSILRPGKPRNDFPYIITRARTWLYARARRTFFRVPSVRCVSTWPCEDNLARRFRDSEDPCDRSR